MAYFPIRECGAVEDFGELLRINFDGLQWLQIEVDAVGVVFANPRVLGLTLDDAHVSTGRKNFRLFDVGCGFI
jgi:hypothetical protein